MTLTLTCPVQFFFCSPVVIELSYYSNTNGWLKKIGRAAAVLFAHFPASLIALAGPQIFLLLFVYRKK